MAEIVPLDAGAYRDIPRQLRLLADEIENGDHPDLMFMLAVLAKPHAYCEVRGWGEYTMLEAIGALTRAVTHPTASLDD